MKILIAGSSGFIGSALVPFLQSKGHEIYSLVREKSETSRNTIFWNPESGEIDEKKIPYVDAVINLSGENISNERWNEEKKRRIVDSRVKSTLLLSDVIAKMAMPPKVFICASATGFYGNRWDMILTEESYKGVGFLAEACVQWEEATEAAKRAGIRVVNLRTGIVLGLDGGILGKLMVPFKLGLAGPLGGGMQYMSWIALDDLVSIVEFCMMQSQIKGPVNAVAPNPVTNEEFTKTLGKVLHRPTFLRLPELVIRLMFGEMADEMLLSSTRVLPQKLLESGFTFKYPRLEEALQHVLSVEQVSQ